MFSLQITSLSLFIAHHVNRNYYFGILICSSSSVPCFEDSHLQVFADGGVHSTRGVQISKDVPCILYFNRCGANVHPSGISYDASLNSPGLTYAVDRTVIHISRKRISTCHCTTSLSRKETGASPFCTVVLWTLFSFSCLWRACRNRGLPECLLANV